MAGKRRAHGEGSIYHRADGRWQARITLPDGTRKSHYEPTQAAARRWLAQAQRERDQGVPMARDERQTLAAYLTTWLDTKKPTIRPRPWERHAINVHKHLIPALGKVRLAQLTTQHVQALYAAKLAAGLAPRTVRNIHATLRCALNEAIELGIIHLNVAKRAKLPRVPRTERPIYTAEQVQTLLDAAAGNRLEALYILVITTGMREGELFALRWRDVDLDAAALYVRQNVQRVLGQGAVMFEPKTEGGKRRVELSDLAVDALRAHRTRQLAERMAATPGTWHDRDLVFATGRGNPWAPQNFHLQQYKPLIARAGLPYIHFHDLRHTAATLMRESGVDILVVSQQLGHASVAITLGLYGHVRPAARRQGAEAMDRLFGRAGRQDGAPESRA